MRKAIVSELPPEFSASRAAAHVIVHYGRGAVTAPLLALADSAGESCVCCACPCLPSIVTSPECPMLRGTNCVRVEEQSVCQPVEGRFGVSCDFEINRPLPRRVDGDCRRKETGACGAARTTHVVVVPPASKGGAAYLSQPGRGLFRPCHGGHVSQKVPEGNKKWSSLCHGRMRLER